MAENVNPAPTESVTQLLSFDHRRLDAILADAKRLLADGDVSRACACFAEFRSGLERHIAAEEQILFPVLEAVTGAVGRASAEVMRTEHTEIRKLMAQVTDNLERGGGVGHTTPLAALTARVYAHNGKEERTFYPATDAAARGVDALAALRQRIGSDARAA